MIFEIGGRTYYLEENDFAPSWWDNWVKKDLKKKIRTFPDRIKRQGKD
jgi:hypothetical protein